MAKCINCSAPLPANTNRCQYCGTRNDVDLSGKRDYSVVREQSELLCPHCRKPLQTIDINLNGTFLIERCENCFGLFFDPGQVETLLDSAVANVFQINLQHIDTINQDRFQSEAAKYIKCPVCQVLMNRKAYGYRSGVVIDYCKNHGVWLDNGEITHLLEWKKAGGQLLQEQRVSNTKARIPGLAQSANNTDSLLDYTFENIETNVADAVVSVVSKLFGL